MEAVVGLASVETGHITAEQVVKAVAMGDVDNVRELLGRCQKKVLNTRIEPLGWTPLHVAAASGDVPVVEMLLSKVRVLAVRMVLPRRSVPAALVHRRLTRVCTTRPLCIRAPTPTSPPSPTAARPCSLPCATVFWRSRGCCSTTRQRRRRWRTWVTA